MDKERHSFGDVLLLIQHMFTFLPLWSTLSLQVFTLVTLPV